MRVYIKNMLTMSMLYPISILVVKKQTEDAVQNLFLKIWNIRADIDENKPFKYFFIYNIKELSS